MVSVPLPAGAKPSGQVGKPLAKKPLVIAAAATGAVVLGSVAARQRVSPVKRARQDLLRELSSAKRDTKKLDALVDTLVASRERFDEALIGGGAWTVVYSSGDMLSQHWTAPGWLFGAPDNRSSQEFSPLGHRVITRGQLGPWAELFVTAEGTYEVQEGSSQMPRPIKATITGGTLHCWGHKIPLPLRGEGVQYLAYSDDSLRILRSDKGAVTVQVRGDQLGSLLKKK